MTRQLRRSPQVVFSGLLALALLLCIPAWAGASAEDSRVFISGAPIAGYESVWNQFTARVYSTFNNRTRMIQLGAVAAALGLFIMLRKMPGQT
jgi:hypothetical protein